MFECSGTGFLAYVLRRAWLVEGVACLWHAVALKLCFQVNKCNSAVQVLPRVSFGVMAAELREFVQSVESAGKDESFEEFVITGLAANHITACAVLSLVVCLRCTVAAGRCWISCAAVLASLAS